MAQEICQFFPDEDRNAVMQQLGSFIIREGSYHEAAPSEMEAYWRSRAISVPKVAKFALRLLSIAPTEAARRASFA